MKMKQPLLNKEPIEFCLPVKRIYDSQGTSLFQSSVAIFRLKYFISKYIKLVPNVDIPDESYVSEIPTVNKLVKLISELSLLVDETPPAPGPRRFGNLSCREWHKKVDLNLKSLLMKMLTDDKQNISSKCKDSVVELSYYLGNSFGSSTRLDYGTGHELSFIAVIAGIDMLGLWTENIKGGDLLIIFNEYYKLMKKLILTYTLEPAGSHGVWGLDDHFHFAYILGSAQWSETNNPPLKPMDIVNKDLVCEYANTNMYCSAIKFIDCVKSGPFSEHSPMLYDISQSVHNWSKVESGLLKMYMVEVLNKFPVVQHFWFGTGLFPWIDNNTKKSLPLYENDAKKTTSIHTKSPSPSPLGISTRRDFSKFTSPALNRNPICRNPNHLGIGANPLRKSNMGPPSTNSVNSIFTRNSPSI
ncbi:hypothetical protein Kpol_2001p77 [Vanderwaltozyma polyspora DSM 70294]|uniref:Serine/threonine-protein phosphatase 2A activator n=1 Tax=Vanderwaltozyma polyspora (strain ATCC 22028 / DSM 70294 / BCRC 21397 / CBS 2163 / NBRC 10782 / NRRL Y-8283 / UCD 57-17) TaxID=436907 RepID=A7TGV5_VANPO|nr:uncharacterized protein Kpol_2001p77 [Vanderwaltozyma polyspora DSM 70294]EDO18568.1 hypothetical protein Kpol_2001p77 [Vanderwaltozyma polyspora DSM 70294]